MANDQKLSKPLRRQKQLLPGTLLKDCEDILSGRCLELEPRDQRSVSSGIGVYLAILGAICFLQQILEHSETNSLTYINSLRMFKTDFEFRTKTYEYITYSRTSVSFQEFLL